jgi:1-phosphofructokinase family hexose kinase
LTHLAGQPIYTVTLNPGLDRTLTVPEIRYNEVLRASEVHLDWGGKGFNVSRALMALGVPSVAMGFVGGRVGDMLKEGLHELGIATDFVTIAGESRTNTVFAEAGSDRYLKVNEAGPAVDGCALDALYGRVEELAEAGGLWTLCGSLPPGVPTDTYAHLVASIQRAGGLAFLDASGPALVEGCRAKPFLVKPNAEEAAEVVGAKVESREDALRAAQHFLGAGVSVVALSMGADGLVLASQTGTVAAKPPAVEAHTLVGVGDAMLAGLIYGVRSDLELPDIARWGVAAGTAAAMGQGVSVGSKETVSGLVERVELHELT